MIARGCAWGLAAAAAALALTAPGASALTKETGVGVDRGDGVFVGTAQCDRGERVISGGFSMPDESDAVVNKRKGRRTWIVKGQDTSGPLTVFAYCSRSLQVSAERAQGTIDLDGTGEGSATARCGRGRVAVAGGWRFEQATGNQPVFTSYGSGARSWRLVAASGDSATITAYAYCLRSDRVNARDRTSGPIADNGQGSVSVGCRRGDELLGGGFKTTPRPDYDNATGPDLFFSDSRRAGRRGWFASAHNYSSVAGRIKLAAICLG